MSIVLPGTCLVSCNGTAHPMGNIQCETFDEVTGELIKSGASDESTVTHNLLQSVRRIKYRQLLYKAALFVM
jgi:hypothetical protein